MPAAAPARSARANQRAPEAAYDALVGVGACFMEFLFRDAV
jgi:hypothetical protein